MHVTEHILKNRKRQQLCISKEKNENLNQHLHVKIINDFISHSKEKNNKNNVHMEIEETVKFLSNNVYSMIKRQK